MIVEQTHRHKRKYKKKVRNENNLSKNVTKMQSETADFVPGAATWRTGRNRRVIFGFGLFGTLSENMTSST